MLLIGSNPMSALPSKATPNATYRMSAACIVLSAHANPATEYRRRTSQLKSVFTSVA